MISRFLSRSPRLAALVAAGALGASALAADPPVKTSVTAVAPTLAAHETEMQVEMAWMSDPASFRCPLRARISAAGLEVTGFVSSREIKNRVVRLAEEIAGGKVVDRLSIARVPDERVKVGPQVLLRNVRQSLNEGFGEQATNLNVSVRPDGQVTLKGRVADLADKHAASVRMRLVRGCTAVVNQIEVGSTSTVATRPAVSKKVVTARPVNSKPTSSTKPSVVMPISSAKSPASPVSPYGRVTTAKTETDSPYNVVPVGNWEPAPLPSEKIIATTPSTQETRPPVAKPQPRLAPAPLPSTLTTPSQKTKRPSPLFAQDQKVVTPAAKAEPIVSQPLTSDRMPIPSSTVQSEEIPAPVSSRPRLLPEFLRKPFSSRPKPPVKPYVTLGTAVIHDDVMPAAARVATTKAGAPAISTKAAAPAVTTKVASPAIAKTEDTLRLRVIGACEGMVKDVVVQSKPNGKQEVTLRIGTDIEIEKVLRLALQVPEMQASDIELAVEIMP